MQEIQILRHEGKPTSGRFVYWCTGGWYWQCDMHIEEEFGVGGEIVSTMQEAFAQALEHAAVCQYCAAARRTRSHA